MTQKGERTKEFMGIFKARAGIVSQKKIGENIFDLLIHFPQGAKSALPGQFVSLYCNDATRLLPRPISICGIDREAGNLRLIYRVAGKGTDEFSAMKAGDSLEVMGPLGNGFPLKDKPAILIGGGIGIPPMLELARQLPGEKNVVLGYRDRIFLLEDFRDYAPVHVATENGSIGAKGTVLDAIRQYGIQGQVIYACGPMPMLKAVSAYAKKEGLEAWISLEERMACGIGACLGCIVKTGKKDPHTNVNNSRICKDGPVFDAREVVFS